MNNIKLINFNISTILDYGYCSHLYTFNKLINNNPDNFLSNLKYKYTPPILNYSNKIKLDITDDKINFINKHLNKNNSFHIYENYKKIYINNFYLFINIIPNFNKIYKYLINKNYLISFTFYDKDLCYINEVFEYYFKILTDNNLFPHLYHKSENINYSINYYSQKLKIRENEILNVDNNFFNLINTNIKNVAIINNSSYIGIPYIHTKLLELNDNNKYIEFYNFSKTILTNCKTNYLINDISNIQDIV